MDYQARLMTPFCVLGICCSADMVTRIDYLPATTPELAPQSHFSATVVVDVLRYLADPAYPFQVPYLLHGSPYQRRVWEQIASIAVGTTRTYGDLARNLGSAPRAVGRACGANPVPLLVPCHRVVAQGGLGGFSQSAAPSPYKEWLLRHEGAR